MATGPTPPLSPENGKHLVIFLRGICVHTYWNANEIPDRIATLERARQARSGILTLLDGRGCNFWLEIERIDGWMVKDIEPSMGQMLIAQLEKAHQPPEVPGDEWKKG